jgi:hypothetical protein
MLGQAAGLRSNGFGASHHGSDTIGRKSIRADPISDKETHPKDNKP